jgi:hypothetical protein
LLIFVTHRFGITQIDVVVVVVVSLVATSLVSFTFAITIPFARSAPLAQSQSQLESRSFVLAQSQSQLESRSLAQSIGFAYVFFVFCRRRVVMLLSIRIAARSPAARRRYFHTLSPKEGDVLRVCVRD